MQRRHYKLIASFLKECHDKAAWCFDNDEDYEMIVDLAENYFGNQNANYDSDKFRTACGL